MQRASAVAWEVWRHVNCYTTLVTPVGRATSDRRRLSSRRCRPRSARATGPRRTSLGLRNSAVLCVCSNMYPICSNIHCLQIFGQFMDVYGKCKIVSVQWVQGSVGNHDEGSRRRPNKSPTATWSAMNSLTDLTDSEHCTQRFVHWEQPLLSLDWAR